MKNTIKKMLEVGETVSIFILLLQSYIKLFGV